MSQGTTPRKHGLTVSSEPCPKCTSPSPLLLFRSDEKDRPHGFREIESSAYDWEWLWSFASTYPNFCSVCALLCLHRWLMRTATHRYPTQGYQGSQWQVITESIFGLLSGAFRNWNDSFTIWPLFTLKVRLNSQSHQNFVNGVLHPAVCLAWHQCPVVYAAIAVAVDLYHGVVGQ